MVRIIEPKTERLQLRQWTSNDLEPFFAMSSDPQVMKFFPKTLNRNESDAIAKKCESLIAQNGWGVWAVEHIVSKEFIGIVGLFSSSSKLPFSPCVEILWRLARPQWGRGYATEAALAALKVGFEELELQEIVSFAVQNNYSSLAVMERINMLNTGVTFEHPDVPDDSRFKEHCLFKILRDSWAKNVA
ncbi:GNAT family N-acetyltransferase [Pseudocolwellia agarivorans]|uniref:GNAT family N-acetyltransferase n=1 Tax=Pseudocolwellia agarivorans TaxID=1911682 RepID=UPI0009868ABD|nr:GNAT family N-acetyltransferase [Pseudocolwellia agarivorans]